MSGIGRYEIREIICLARKTRKGDNCMVCGKEPECGRCDVTTDKIQALLDRAIFEEKKRIWMNVWETVCNSLKGE